MFRNTISVPARRTTAVLGATVALAAGTFAFGPAAQAQTRADSSAKPGQATATDLRTDLDVSLLNKTVNAPLSVALNDVKAPADADRTALEAHINGVDKGQPIRVLDAQVAKSKATSNAQKNEGFARLVHAHVHLPGLPLLSLVDVDAVSSKATCEAGQAPKAAVNFVGDVKVLGQKVALKLGGTTKVNVPGVGEVTLDMAKKATTSSTAAATALQLQVHINPAKLNVADVKGDVTLVQATCKTPAGGGNGGSGANGGGSASSPQGGGSGLAETGASSTTPYIAGGAAVLILGGGGAVYASRRRKATQG